MTTPFRLDVLEESHGRRFALSGEFDLAGAPIFEQALQAACADGARAITLDLSGLTFIDSTGLRAILAGQQLCVGDRREYWIERNMSPPVKRLLEIAGVGRIPFIGSTEPDR
jgi:anti-sigma B factor antagonist